VAGAPAAAAVATPPPAVPQASPAPEARPATATAPGVGKPALVVEGQRGETAVRFILEGEMTIGREAADILIEDEQASRRHAQVRVDGDRVELTDIGSANGTEVNGERVTETVTLSHGDSIKVGTTMLKLELPPSMRGPKPGDATVIAG
jgi:pSer/pThr/pTyr-binding forkhead associated (FHA) protein